MYARIISSKPQVWKNRTELKHVFYTPIFTVSRVENGTELRDLFLHASYIRNNKTAEVSINNRLFEIRSKETYKLYEKNYKKRKCSNPHLTDFPLNFNSRVLIFILLLLLLAADVSQ
jgi:hypothetical protein